MSEKTTVTVMSTANTRLFESQHTGLWKDMEKHHPDIPFYFYHENSFEINSSGDSIDFGKIPKSYSVVDLFESNPWLHEFLKTSRFKDCHKIGSQNSVRLKADDDYFKRNAIYWFRKIVALHDCAKRCNTDLLIFLGFDSFLTPNDCAIDDEYVDYVKNYDVCYINRDKIARSPESDHLVFNLKGQGRNLIDETLEYFKDGRAFEERRWDDAYILYKAIEIFRKDVSGFKEGFLTDRSVQWSPSNTEAPKDFTRIVNHHKGNWGLIRDLKPGL
tara:strand:+ start:7184 stop:8002 length:819 start_codon:yes stop_codon:yes gene_type:complete